MILHNKVQRVGSILVFYIHSSQAITTLDVVQVAGAVGIGFFFEIAKSVVFGKQYIITYAGVQAGAAEQAVGAVSDKIILGTLANVRGFVKSSVAYALPVLGQQRAGGITDARNGVRAGIGEAVAVGAYVAAGKDVAVVGVAGGQRVTRNGFGFTIKPVKCIVGKNVPTIIFKRSPLGEVAALKIESTIQVFDFRGVAAFHGFDALRKTPGIIFAYHLVLAAQVVAGSLPAGVVVVGLPHRLVGGGGYLYFHVISFHLKM